MTEGTVTSWNKLEQKNLLKEVIRWKKGAAHLQRFTHTVNECQLTIQLYEKSQCDESNVTNFLRNILLRRDTTEEEEDFLILKTEEDEIPFDFDREWKRGWVSFADLVKCSYISLKDNEVEEEEYHPLYIRPHFVPFYLIIVDETRLITVTQLLETDWVPLETFLRFHRSHMKNMAQTLQMFAICLNEVYSQLCSLYFFCPLNLTGFYIDKSCWLLFDPVVAVTTKEKSLKLDVVTKDWVTGKLSNFHYLLKLGELAGRVYGDVHNHHIMPWVCDFSDKRGGWRDLTKTKYRLNKGDDQLKEMYLRSPPHHIPELLSDIGYMVYRARVEKREKLCKHVRSKWVPLEYPVSIRRMFEWTPDECIPEFYNNPFVFESIHPDMPSLELPEFAPTPDEFIKWHREMLESDEVSSQLHHWIDLTYGYLLTGDEAINSLNCHLSLGDTPSIQLRRHGVVQLFQYPHPKKYIRKKGENIDYLYLDEMEVAASINQEKGINKKEQKTEDMGDLLQMYRNLLKDKEDRLAKYNNRMRGVYEMLAMVAMAPYTYGQFDKEHVLSKLKQNSNCLPSLYGDSLKSVLLENARLPQIRFFSSHFLGSLKITMDILTAHGKLSQFYSYHLLRRSPHVHNNETREQNILVKEVENLRKFIIEADLYDFVFIPLFERLIRDPVSCITSVYCLFNMMCKRLSQESLQALLPSLASLLTYESSIKLIDRRFLLSVSFVYGTPIFLDRFLPALVEAVASKHLSRSIVAKDSLLWLSKRLGPIVTVRFITSNLLRIMPTAFDGLYLAGGNENLSDVTSLNFLLEGDEWCQRIESALGEIALSYSITFVTVQYLPFCVDYTDQCLRRMTPNLEGGLVGIFKIISLSIKIMKDQELMNYLEEFIVDKILLKIITFSLQSTTPFSNDRSRVIILSRAILLLYSIATRIGADNTRMYAKKPFEVLFNTFHEQTQMTESLTVSKKESSTESFNIPIWLMSEMINKFASLWGVPLLSALCPHPPFLVPFISSKVLSNATEYSQPAVSPLASFNFGGSSSCSSGNRLFSAPPSSPPRIGGVGTSESGSLSAIWCARVSATACSTTNSKQTVRFDQLTLCSFEGHTGAVKCLEVLSNENSYISGSADKTIKLWAMNPEFESVEARWTYRAHTRPIVDLLSIHDNFIASTDGSVHIWDPFRGSRISVIDWPEGTICGLGKVDRNTLATISSLHSTVRLYDVRDPTTFCDMKISPTTGLTRALSIRKDGPKMAVTLSNGTIALIDSRTGKLFSLSHGNNTHPTTVNWLSDSKFLVTDADESAVVFDTVPRISSLRRLGGEVILNAHVTDDILTTLVANSTMRVYKDEQACLEVRLKSDCMPGTAVSAHHLPLNNAFLIGSSQGALKLMC
ncbi:unnamed protein product [Auanema sp. JU1783]|nr:unnamed protein product [Auanema sp. JU1783]